MTSTVGLTGLHANTGHSIEAPSIAFHGGTSRLDFNDISFFDLYLCGYVGKSCDSPRIRSSTAKNLRDHDGSVSYLWILNVKLAKNIVNFFIVDDFLS